MRLGQLVDFSLCVESEALREMDGDSGGVEEEEG